MILFTTETINKTKLILNPKHIAFIQENKPIGYIIVMNSGAAHNLSIVEAERLINVMTTYIIDDK